MKKKLVFLHIPKAAGSTFHLILEMQYPIKNTYTISGGKNLEESYSIYKNLPDKKREKINILKGHIPYGAHKYINGNAKYITFLRNPLERLISHYYYIKRNPEHYLYERINKNNLSLGQIIEQKLSTEFDNGQTRLLSGNFAGIDKEPFFGEVNENMYKLALRNIDNDFVGVYIAEYFDESVLLLKKQLNWTKNPYYKRLNVTENRPKLNQLDDNEINIINQSNKFDIQLYNYCKTKFLSLIEENKITIDTINYFKEKNSLFNHYYKFHNAKRKLRKLFNQKILN